MVQCLYFPAVIETIRVTQSTDFTCVLANALVPTLFNLLQRACFGLIIHTLSSSTLHPLPIHCSSTLDPFLIYSSSTPHPPVPLNISPNFFFLNHTIRIFSLLLHQLVSFLASGLSMDHYSGSHENEAIYHMKPVVFMDDGSRDISAATAASVTGKKHCTMSTAGEEVPLSLPLLDENKMVGEKDEVAIGVDDHVCFKLNSLGEPLTEARS
jgi:hypothetical protein